MKKLILITVAAVALMVTHAANAQVFKYTWKNLGVTNNVANNYTATNGPAGQAGAGAGTNKVDATAYDQVGINIQFALNAAGTTACVFKFATSMDGTNWNVHLADTHSIVPAGTTPVGTNVTVNLGAAGYWRLESITAANNTAAMTNIVVGYAYKPSRRENIR